MTTKRHCDWCDAISDDPFPDGWLAVNLSSRTTSTGEADEYSYDAEGYDFCPTCKPYVRGNVLVAIDPNGAR